MRRTCTCAGQARRCYSGRLYVLHHNGNMTRAEGHAFCRARHGPWASLAELDTNEHWANVLGFMKQVTGAAGQ